MNAHNQEYDKLVVGSVNTFYYTNYKGERQLRNMIPLCLRYGIVPYHEGPQWFVECFDCNKRDYRTLALKDIEIVNKDAAENRNNLFPQIKIPDASHQPANTTQSTGRRESIQPDTTRHENET